MIRDQITTRTEPHRKHLILRNPRLASGYETSDRRSSQTEIPSRRVRTLQTANRADSKNNMLVSGVYSTTTVHRAGIEPIKFVEQIIRNIERTLNRARGLRRSIQPLVAN